MMQSDKRRRLLGATGLSLLGTAAMGQAQAQVSDNEQVVTLGFAGGFGVKLQSNLSFSARDGALLAVEEANQRRLVIGGKPTRFALMVVDDQSEPNFARICANAFVAAKVAAVVGHNTTDTSVAATPIYAEAGIAQVSPTSTGRIFTSRGYTNVFQLLGHSDTSTDYLAEIATQVIGARRIAVLDNGTLLGVTLADGVLQKLKFAGVTPVARDSVPPKTSDFNAPLQRIKLANPDLLYFTGVGPQVPSFLQNFRRLGLRSKLLVAGGAANLEFPRSGPFPDRTFLLMHGQPPEKRPGYADFEKAYRRRFESALSAYTLFSYDAVGMLVEAMRRADSAEPRKITAEMHRLQYKGISGTVSFGADGSQVNPPYSLYEAMGGRWQAIRSYGL